jgi:hypothetical protein
MARKRLGWGVTLAAMFLAGFAARGVVSEPVAQAQAAQKVYELRTYVVPEDKLAALNTRFRDHTMRMFQKHGIASVAYFTPQDPAKAKNTLIYLISHPSRQAASQNWAAFLKDPVWQKIAADSGVPRPAITSEFLDPTDYSPMK